MKFLREWSEYEVLKGVERKDYSIKNRKRIIL